MDEIVGAREGVTCLLPRETTDPDERSFVYRGGGVMVGCARGKEV